MANAVKAEGLILAYTDASGNVYPFACAKDASIDISKDFIELAPKTNGVFREYISGRQGYTMSGSGLVKVVESNMHPITFFDSFIEGTANSFIGYLDIIDDSNNLKVYKFSCFIQSLSLSATVGGFGQYNYSLQGNGPITEISTIDTYTVATNKITGRNTSTFKLVAVGYGGKWYYNYAVTSPSAGVYEILMPGVANGTEVKAVYISL